MKENKKYGFLKIEGINHIRYVGIWEGLATDFAPVNAGGYSAPKTEAEIKACEEKAIEYYNSCIQNVRTGKFGLKTISEEKAEEIGDILAAFIL